MNNAQIRSASPGDIIRDDQVTGLQGPFPVIIQSVDKSYFCPTA